MPNSDWDDFVVRDFNGGLIEVGTQVLAGDPKTDDDILIYTGKVTKITDPDVDYDDELQRAVMYPPKITVFFGDGTDDEFTTHDNTSTRWADYPDGPRTYIFICDDLEVWS